MSEPIELLYGRLPQDFYIVECRVSLEDLWDPNIVIDGCKDRDSAGECGEFLSVPGIYLHPTPHKSIKDENTILYKLPWNYPGITPGITQELPWN